MKGLMTMFFSVLLILSALSVAAVPVSIDRAEIDDTEILPNGVNILDIERNQDFELELKLQATSDVQDVEIRAFISGYEFNDVKPIGDNIGPLDFDENVTYVRKMTLSLPDDVDLDDYKLRVIISDRNGDEEIYTYTLQVNTKRHDLKIEDVILSPGSVKAGQALLAVVRLDNKGQKDEDDVKVTVSIPALSVSGTDYINEVESNEEEETEEIFLRLPKCAEAGLYEAMVDVLYNDGHDKVSKSVQFNVLENEACAEDVAPVVVIQETNQTTVTVEPEGNAVKVRGALEIILLVLVALLVIVGLIIGFSRMRGEE